MEALKALAETNTKIGEARGILSQLKAEETQYLSEREARAIEMIQEVLEDSEQTLKTAFANYEEIKKFASDAADFALVLTDAHADFQALQQTFNSYTASWQETIKSVENNLAELKNKIKIDQIQVKEDQAAVQRAWKQIGEEKRKIRSDRETLERAITRLKEGRI